MCWWFSVSCFALRTLLSLLRFCIVMYMKITKTPKVENILNLMHYRTSEYDELVQRAYMFAEEAHTDQKRYSGEPYFIHVFETAKILADIGMSATTIAAGLLHDTIEDAEVDPETLKKEFGDEVCFLVEGVTKLEKVRYRGATRHNESLRKLFVAVSQDLRVLIIKLADRLHNIRTLEYVPEDKRERIAMETLEIYAPIAYRLGIKKLSRALEDNAFAYVYPDEYQNIVDLLKERKDADEKQLKKFIRSLNKTLAENGMRDAKIDYRIKGLYSLYCKLKRKKTHIGKIYDIAAVRIIVPTVADCYSVLGVLHSVWRPLPGRIKDYIAFTKPNGYQSIHTTLFIGDGSIVEVQIKTEQMHREAEYGVASHILYKEGVTQKKQSHPSMTWINHLLPQKRRDNGHTYDDMTENLHDLASNADVPSWIKELVDYQHEYYDHANMEGEMKGDFFEHRIFVFTPQGDVIDLPVDSSPVDFAYAIHSDIGDTLDGAKVNGKLVSLDTSLQNGDIVNIITKPKNKPSTKWLDYTKTTLAQRRIRQATGTQKS